MYVTFLEVTITTIAAAGVAFTLFVDHRRKKRRDKAEDEWRETVVLLLREINYRVTQVSGGGDR